MVWPVSVDADHMTLAAASNGSSLASSIPSCVRISKTETLLFSGKASDSSTATPPDEMSLVSAVSVSPPRMISAAIAALKRTCARRFSIACRASSAGTLHS